MTSSSQARFSKSNGNVFEDLRLPNAAAAFVTSSLAALVARHLRRRALAVADATNVLGSRGSTRLRSPAAGSTGSLPSASWSSSPGSGSTIVHESPAPAG